MGLEVTGGAGVLVSGAGVETKLHLHDMSVLNMVWAVAHLEPGSGRLAFSYPDREGGLPIRNGREVSRYGNDMCSSTR